MARSSKQTAHSDLDSDRHCISPNDMTVDIFISVCVCWHYVFCFVFFSFYFYPDRAVVKMNVRRCHVVTFIKLRHRYYFAIVLR